MIPQIFSLRKQELVELEGVLWLMQNNPSSMCYTYATHSLLASNQARFLSQWGDILLFCPMGLQHQVK
jgi:hypothetical protein